MGGVYQDYQWKCLMEMDQCLRNQAREGKKEKIQRNIIKKKVNKLNII